jgi:heme oxygenase
MSLKELTKDLHKQAESTLFMTSVFKKNVPKNIWKDFLYQKYFIYGALENKADEFGLLDDISDVKRQRYIYHDYINMILNIDIDRKKTTDDYVEYINNITDQRSVLAHVYTWHMGDMYGGQMISKIVDAPSTHLHFDNINILLSTLRLKLDDSLADEANVAFEWAIKLLKEYDYYFLG